MWAIVNIRKHVPKYIQQKIVRTNARKKHVQRGAEKNCKDNIDCIFFKSNSCEFLHKREDTEKMRVLLQENKELKEQIESGNKFIEKLTGKIEALVQRVERLEKDKVQDNHIVFKHPDTEKNNFPLPFYFQKMLTTLLK